MPEKQYLAKHSWQQLAKNKNWLNDLTISEVSLVDTPACSYATVALRKRDGTTDHYERVLQPSGRFLFQKKAKPTPGELALPVYPEHQDPEFRPLERPSKGDSMPITAKRKKKKQYLAMMEGVAKGDASITLLDQERAVHKRALQIALKTGESNVQKIEARLWEDLYTRGAIAVDDKTARLEKIQKLQKRNAYGIPQTAAEIKIDSIAKTIAKRDNVGIARATDLAWREHPALYSQYLAEFNSDLFQELVQKSVMSEDIDNQTEDEEDAEDDGDDGDDGEDYPKPMKRKCKCNKFVKADMNFCPSCGAKLKAA
jgi:hypothetical protein